MTDFSSEFPENTVQASIMDSTSLPEKKYYAAVNSTVYRLNADKTLDTTFGINGIADVSFVTRNYKSLNGDGTITKIIARENGNVFVQVLVSYRGDDFGRFGDEFLFQLDNQGKVIPDFGNNGVILYEKSKGREIKFYNGGFFYYGSIKKDDNYDKEVFVAKYTSDGKLINDFTIIRNMHGIVMDIGYSLNYGFYFKEDGKILIRGIQEIDNVYFTTIHQFQSNGLIDESFGNNGLILLSDTHFYGGNKISVNNNDEIEIIYSGTTYHPNYEKFSELIVLHANGVLKSRLPLPNYKEIDKITKVVNVLKKSEAKLLQTNRLSNGKLLSVGSSNSKLTIARYTANGQLDTTFHNKGYLINKNLENPIQVEFFQDYFLVLFKNGKLKKYTHEGIEVPSFIYDKVNTNSFKILKDGSIITRIEIFDQFESKESILNRILPEGIQDNLFLIKEETNSSFPICNKIYRKTFGIGKDQTIITYSMLSDAINRYNSKTGQLINQVSSTDFFKSGYSIECSTGKTLKSIEETDEGKITLLSHRENISDDGDFVESYYFIEKINSNGTTDTAFKLIKHKSIETYQNLDDKSILIGGKEKNGFYLQKYLPTGILDTTFGTDGKVEVPQFANEQQISNIILKENGGIIISGTTNDNFNLIELQEKEVLSTETISNNKENNAYYISPNPIKDFAELISLTSTNSIEKIQIFNLFGGLVKTIHVNHEQRITGLEDRIQLNLSELQQGIYLLKVIDTKNKATIIKAIKK